MGRGNCVYVFDGKDNFVGSKECEAVDEIKGETDDEGEIVADFVSVGVRVRRGVVVG